MASIEPRLLDPHVKLWDLFVLLHRAHAGSEPLERPTMRDSRALLNILDEQCCGDFEWASDQIRELFTGAGGTLHGSLHKRWAALIVWYQTGKPEQTEQRVRRGA